MGKEFGLLIVTLLVCLNSCFSQTTELPDSIIIKIIDELIIKDGLLTDNKLLREQVKTVIEQNKTLKESIIKYIQIGGEKDSIILDLNQLINIKNSELTDCKHKKNTKSIKSFFTGTVVGVIFTVTILLL